MSPAERGLEMLKMIVAAGILLTAPNLALADGTCKSTAADKKLAGAAFNSFMKKCEKDAGATCDATAATKKLAGAAKTSFSKKCVSDAVGS